ncbi:hypothetical protein C8R43DRAFT_1233068 [Mycena crocata]|nr:hypothetical protein C8R43DRAFT_1233068 [Mycena crocata]
MSNEIGTLVIVVLKARNLNNHSFWKQDVLAMIGLNGETKRTKVDVKGGQHPMWDEELRIPILKDTGEKSRKLQVSCWAKEPKKEENLGQGVVDLAETLKTGEFDDWVTLETNGVARGEIYLEMTFFTNAPAPVGLTAPKAQLQRRPSKLSPAERLARPPLTAPNTASAAKHRQQQDPYGQPANGYLGPSPPHSRTPSTSPPRTGRQSPLPPLPEGNAPAPNTLTPGRGQGLPQHVPSILRPRNPKSSPTPIPRPTSEYSGVVPPPDHGYAPESPPRGYTPVVPASNSTYDDAYVPPPHEPQRWGSNHSPAEFSFPVPSLGGAREPTVEYSAPYNPSPPAGYGAPGGRDRHGSTSSFTPPASFTPPPAPSFQPQPPYQQQPSSFQPPPQSFQQPFQQPPQQPPFPPQSPVYQQPPPTFQPPAAFQHSPPTFQAAPPFQPPASSFHHQPPPANKSNELPDPYLLARYQSPLPLPPGADNPPRQRTSSHAGGQAPPAESKPAPAPPSKATPPSTQSNPDNARLQALRQVEEEAARRRAQEEKDRELARQLDRELNLGEA